MDKRRLNGNKGHSTKAKGLDRRKSEYKEVLNTSLTPDELSDVVKGLYDKAIQDKDVPASKLLLEYYLGKPTQKVEQENTIITEPFSIKDIINFK